MRLRVAERDLPERDEGDQPEPGDAAEARSRRAGARAPAAGPRPRPRGARAGSGAKLPRNGSGTSERAATARHGQRQQQAAAAGRTPATSGVVGDRPERVADVAADREERTSRSRGGAARVGGELRALGVEGGDAEAGDDDEQERRASRRARRRRARSRSRRRATPVGSSQSAPRRSDQSAEERLDQRGRRPPRRASAPPRACTRARSGPEERQQRRQRAVREVGREMAARESGHRASVELGPHASHGAEARRRSGRRPAGAGRSARAPAPTGARRSGRGCARARRRVAAAQLLALDDEPADPQGQRLHGGAVPASPETRAGRKCRVSCRVPHSLYRRECAEVKPPHRARRLRRGSASIAPPMRVEVQAVSPEQVEADVLAIPSPARRLAGAAAALDSSLGGLLASLAADGELRDELGQPASSTWTGSSKSAASRRRDRARPTSVDAGRAAHGRGRRRAPSRRVRDEHRLGDRRRRCRCSLGRAGAGARRGHAPRRLRARALEAATTSSARSSRRSSSAARPTASRRRPSARYRIADVGEPRPRPRQQPAERGDARAARRASRRDRLVAGAPRAPRRSARTRSASWGWARSPPSPGRATTRRGSS